MNANYPAPWKAIQLHEGTSIIDATGSDVPLSYDKVAARIVAAVNCHDELLAACHAMLAEIRVWEDHHGTHPAATLARAAIYKAESGAP